MYPRECELKKQFGGIFIFCGIQLIQDSLTLEPRGLNLMKSLVGAKVAETKMNHIKCDHYGAEDDS